MVFGEMGLSSILDVEERYVEKVTHEKPQRITNPSSEMASKVTFIFKN